RSSDLAVPLADGRGQQSFVDGVGGSQVLEAGGPPEAPIQSVRPCMVRAHDAATVGGGSALQELVAAVAADVVEAAQRSVGVANEQDPLRSHPDRGLVTRPLE